MGLRVRTEVFGLFAGSLSRAARDKLGRWTRCKRQGLVPHLLVGVPLESGAAEEGASVVGTAEAQGHHREQALTAGQHLGVVEYAQVLCEPV